MAIGYTVVTPWYTSLLDTHDQLAINLPTQLAFLQSPQLERISIVICEMPESLHVTMVLRVPSSPCKTMVLQSTYKDVLMCVRYFLSILKPILFELTTLILSTSASPLTRVFSAFLHRCRNAVSCCLRYFEHTSEAYLECERNPSFFQKSSGMLQGSDFPESVLWKYGTPKGHYYMHSPAYYTMPYIHVYLQYNGIIDLCVCAR